jgi:hypothetical protein
MFEIESVVASSAISILFYLAIGVFTISSALTLYSLIRYGKDRIVITGIGVGYAVIALTLFIIALNQLQNIQL